MASEEQNEPEMTLESDENSSKFVSLLRDFFRTFKDKPHYFLLPILFTIFVSVLIHFMVRKLRRHQSQNDCQTRSDGAQDTACASPNCVRCTKYEDAIESASSLYDEFRKLHYSGKTKEPMKRVASAIIRCPKYDPKNRQNPNVVRIEGLTAKPLWSDDEFEIATHILETNYQIILEEFLNIPGNAKWIKNTTPHGSWQVFHLINQGLKQEENCSYVPKTMELIECVPNLMKHNLFGNVCFSVVEPGTWITPHYGPCNTRIRCHLGILTSPQYHLIVDGIRRRSWRNGRCLFFDDSFLHEVRYLDDHNESRDTTSRSAQSLSGAFSGQGSMERDDLSSKPARAVLVIDLWHPDLAKNEVDALNYIFPSSGNSYSQWKCE